MTETQERLLEMLKWYHQFCTNHRLQYYAIGGTMLGAVRHKGFIPWDDDLDVGMPREDYERFLSLVQKTDTGHFLIEAPGQCRKDYCLPYAKIFDTRTTLIENSRQRFKRGLYIDVFPVDGAGKNKLEEVFKYLKIRFLFKLLVARSCLLDKKRNLIKTLFIKFSNVLENLFPTEKIIMVMNKTYTVDDYLFSDKAGNLDWGYGWREHVDKKAWGTPKEYPFEDTVICGAQDYDTYLKAVFGDYMVLPPKEKRRIHDRSFVDFNKSYLEDS